MSADDLERRLERLEAAEGVRELLWRYTTLLDARDPDLGDVFTEDVVLHSGAEHVGRQAVLDYYESVMSQMSFSRHHIVNSSITVESPDRARHQGAFLATLARDGESLLVFGDYDDEAVREADGVWRFRVKRNKSLGMTTLTEGWAGEAFGRRPATQGA